MSTLPLILGSLLLLFLFIYYLSRKEKKSDKENQEEIFPTIEDREEEPEITAWQKEQAKKVAEIAQELLEKRGNKDLEIVEGPLIPGTNYYLFELEDYDPNKPEYFPPYGFDIRIKDIILDKVFFLHLNVERFFIEKEINQQMEQINRGGNYKISFVGTDIYLEEGDKYRFILKKAF